MADAKILQKISEDIKKNIEDIQTNFILDAFIKYIRDRTDVELTELENKRDFLRNFLAKPIQEAKNANGVDTTAKNEKQLDRTEALAEDIFKIIKSIDTSILVAVLMNKYKNPDNLEIILFQTNTLKAKIESANKIVQRQDDFATSKQRGSDHSTD